MFVSYFKVHNPCKKTPEKIEKEFQSTRSNYLRDLEKLRKRYRRTFVDLTQQYNSLTSLAE